MKKIVLLCSAGLSTSMLVEKMKVAAKELDIECSIAAYPIAEAEKEGSTADVIFLGPQVRFQIDAVREQVSCPVEAIDMTAYGMMDGKAVVNRAIELIEGK
ncbi:PTS sugar transporter subunit IIB [Streptococcus marmotae]|uniref:PTS sugar transporter subunit IIB n=1 Tax=Streptococcus marmotae TaxID=1825069 RepID=UPI0008366CAB|nr:PTS sugar transporter subunit IIB [Streptococcus marmotae]